MVEGLRFVFLLLFCSIYSVKILELLINKFYFRGRKYSLLDCDKIEETEP